METTKNRLSDAGSSSASVMTKRNHCFYDEDPFIPPFNIDIFEIVNNNGLVILRIRKTIYYCILNVDSNNLSM